MPKKLEKAKIQVLEKVPGVPKEIPVMFNPENYIFSMTQEISKNDKGEVQFYSVKLDDFTITLLFDTYKEQQKDVRQKIRPIVQLIKPIVEGENSKEPPVCLFIWGKFSYKGIISKIDQEFTMFLPDGTPVRAKLTLTFTSVLTDKEVEEYLGKEACWKLWTVKAGDRIDLIAHEALKDVNLWKKLAKINNIKDPLRFPTEEDIGRVLKIPDLNEESLVDH